MSDGYYMYPHKPELSLSRFESRATLFKPSHVEQNAGSTRRTRAQPPRLQSMVEDLNTRSLNNYESPDKSKENIPSYEVRFSKNGRPHVTAVA